MKVLSTEGLTKLIQLIKAGFISSSDVEQTSEITLATVATTGDYSDLVSGIQSADVTTALGYTPADNDLSNLSSTGKKVIDGQWVYSYSAIGSGVSVNGSTDLDYDLSTYLPNDNYNYEVLVSLTGTSTTTSGEALTVYLSSDIITTNITAFRVIPRTAAAVYGAAFVCVPVGTSRRLSLTRNASYYGTVNITLKAYRRIGTNS